MSRGRGTRAVGRDDHGETHGARNTNAGETHLRLSAGWAFDMSRARVQYGPSGVRVRSTSGASGHRRGI